MCFFSTSRGVGCIFIEMIQGVAAFPGMKDIQDQLERIFLVSVGCFVLLNDISHIFKCKQIHHKQLIFSVAVKGLCLL